MLAEATISLTLVFLFLASIFDLRTGEIPDAVSFGLAAALIFASFFVSAIEGDYSFAATPFIWGLLFFAIGYALFELGQWGGGDVKLMGGIGASLGLLQALSFPFSNLQIFEDRIPPLAVYIINMAFISTPYVVAYTMALGFMNPSAFTHFRKSLVRPKRIAALIMSFLPFCMALFFRQQRIAAVYSLLPLFYTASVYMKSVEDKILAKTIPVGELNDWDILVQDIVVDGVRIAKRRNIEGVNPEQVKKIKELALKGLIPPKIRIRWGVKFAPVLFLAYAATVGPGNLLEILFIWINAA